VQNSTKFRTAKSKESFQVKKKNVKVVNGSKGRGRKVSALTHWRRGTQKIQRLHLIWELSKRKQRMMSSGGKGGSGKINNFTTKERGWKGS